MKRDFNLDFKVAPTDNEFINSLKAQYEKGKDLSTAQMNALMDYKGTRIDLPSFKTKKVKTYYKGYYRTDAYGDYLRDSDVVIDDGNLKLDEKIQDLHAAQYGCEQWEDKYTFKEEIEIPESITDFQAFLIYQKDYCTITEKLKRNRFRSVKSYNNYVRALNSILNETYDETLLDKATGRYFQNRRY